MLFVAEPPGGSAQAPEVQLHRERSRATLPDLDGLQYPSALAVDGDGDATRTIGEGTKTRRVDALVRE